MHFTDPHILVGINNINFKAYLEESETMYEAKDQQLPFTPTSFLNDSLAIRLMEKVKFSFNVFSENRKECVDNYNKLKNLLNSIRPKYEKINDLLVPSLGNLNGFISLRFDGMIERPSVSLHLTNFSYTINKDMGYIDIPRGADGNLNPSTFSGKNNQLIPISYKVNIEGKVLLPFDKTARVTSAGSVREGKNIGELLSKQLTTSDDNDKFRNFVRVATGKALDEYNVDQIARLLVLYGRNRDQILPDGTASNINKTEYNNAVATARNIRG